MTVNELIDTLQELADAGNGELTVMVTRYGDESSEDVEAIAAGIAPHFVIPHVTID